MVLRLLYEIGRWDPNSAGDEASSFIPMDQDMMATGVKTKQMVAFSTNFLGFGRMIYANGDIYEGDWFEDKAHGRGSLKGFQNYLYENFISHYS